MSASNFRLAVCASLAIHATAVGAQCPDGTPPPCRVATVAAARRANPTLDSRRWIVVPFNNGTKSPDLDWLRDASVNLLSLDLSRWTDLTVVDDKRVADLARELSSAKAAAPLTLNDGLALAKRAGAGTLVMGDFYKLGAGARIAANVFDVKTGNRVRSVAQQATNQDSLLSVFGPLARAALALPVPSGAKLGATGTTRVDAYQEFLIGSAALNQFELSEATKHLEKALVLDSTFALAHYKLAIAFHWGDDPDAAAERAQATAAARLGTSLPPRERALITARVVASRGDDARGCAPLAALIGRDSVDVEAMYAVAECEYHAGTGKPEVIDSTHARLRGNFNKAIALFRRVLAQDPTYHPAFGHILDILSRNFVVSCVTMSTSCGNDPTSWTAIFIRDGDSLVIQPAPGAKYLDQVAIAERTRSRYRNMRAAQAIAREWVDAGPAETRAHLALAEVDLSLGEIEAADAELRLIGAASDPVTRHDALADRLEIAALLGHGAIGRALLDTLRREIPDDAALFREIGVIPAAFGDLKAATRALDAFAASQVWSAERAAYWRQLPLVMLGVPDTRAGEIERRYWDVAPGDSVCAAGLPRCRTTALLSTLAYALRMPRVWWPPFETPEIGFRFGPARGLAMRDTAYLRASLVELDSISHTRLVAFGDDQAVSVIGADAALALHDTATALRLTRQFVDSLMPGVRRMTTNVAGVAGWSVLLGPRMMLLRADLAAKLGFREEARLWYRRVLDLWSDADPELKPTVDRIRAALSALSA